MSRYVFKSSLDVDYICYRMLVMYGAGFSLAFWMMLGVKSVIGVLFIYIAVWLLCICDLSDDFRRVYVCKDYIELHGGCGWLLKREIIRVSLWNIKEVYITEGGRYTFGYRRLLHFVMKNGRRFIVHYLPEQEEEAYRRLFNYLKRFNID